MTPSQIVHQLCKSPADDRCAEASGLCYVCGGQVARGVSVQDWMSGSYTDQTRIAVPLASHVCEGCCFVMSRVSPVPGRPPGKCQACEGTGAVTKTFTKGKAKGAKVGDACPKCEGSGMASAGGNYRNYTHMHELGADPQYANASKGEKPAIRDFLAREHRGPWFAAIADSGQKHVLPYAPMNGPGQSGLVLFDEALIKIPRDQSLIGVLCQLLTDGATKEELQRGDYRPATWQRLGAERIRDFERTHGRSRGHWFDLAIWLAQRDESAVQERMASEKATTEAEKQQEKERARQARGSKAPARKSAGGVRGDDTGRVRSVRKGKGADVVLGPDPKPDPKCSPDQCHSVGVRDERKPKDEARSTVQLGLFGGN
jgi:hypothetical protein